MTTLTSEVIRAGAPIGAARAAMILVHGRGASAEGMLGLADAFDASDVAYVAPQARGAGIHIRSWRQFRRTNRTSAML
jgi:phospholipase/carboxylesterase